MTKRNSDHSPSSESSRSTWQKHRNSGFSSGNKNALSPLLEHLKLVDTLRVKLETEGGRASDLKNYIELLNREIRLPGPTISYSFSIADQRIFSSAVRSVAWDVHVQIRQLPTGFPIYYLCRVMSNFFHEYEFVTEELYRSPGYEIVDERFIKLMWHGHERYFLNISDLRDKTEEMIVRNRIKVRADTILRAMGRDIFANAWHEDQRIAFLIARHFPDLSNLQASLELLYLCLTADLAELRNSADKIMMLFLEQVYPHEPLKQFIQKLDHLGGSGLNSISRKAGKLYVHQSHALNRFLSTPVMYGDYNMECPLYKIIFSNLSRMEVTCKTLIAKNKETISNASEVLKTESQSIINELLQ